jgi:hypothetical protein
MIKPMNPAMKQEYHRPLHPASIPACLSVQGQEYQKVRRADQVVAIRIESAVSTRAIKLTGPVIKGSRRVIVGGIPVGASLCSDQ